MKKLLAVLLGVLVAQAAWSTPEVHRQRNVASRVTIEFRDATTGAVVADPSTGLDCDCDPYQDDTSYDGTPTDCTTAEVVDTGEGVVTIPLTATELNNDYLFISCTTSASAVKPVRLTVNTKAGLYPTVEGRTLDVAATGEAGIDLDNTTGTLGSSEVPNLDAAVTSRLAPTTAGRTLDVTTGGAAGIDWANVEGPTTTVGLTNTTVGTSTALGANAVNNTSTNLTETLTANPATGGIVAGSFGAGAIDNAAFNVTENLNAVLADAAHGGASATLVLSDYSNFQATGFSTHSALDVIAQVTGTADSGSTTTLVDAARTEAETDYWKDSCLLVTSGSTNGVLRQITAFNPGTDTITFSPALPDTEAISTNTYAILRSSACLVTAGGGDASAANQTEILARLGDEADAASTGDPGTTATIPMLKQLINNLMGSAGVATFPAAAACGDGVSIAECLRETLNEVAGLNGSAMRGTDNAFLAASAPTNFSSMVIDANGRVDISLVEGKVASRALGIKLAAESIPAQTGLTDVDGSGGTGDEIKITTSLEDGHFVGGTLTLYPVSGNPQSCNIDFADSATNQLSCANNFSTAPVTNDVVIVHSGVGERLASTGGLEALDPLTIKCTVSSNGTRNATTFQCDASDPDGNPITSGFSAGDLKGKVFTVQTSSTGQKYEELAIDAQNGIGWDGTNFEIIVNLPTLAPLPAALGVGDIIYIKP